MTHTRSHPRLLLPVVVVALLVSGAAVALVIFALQLHRLAHAWLIWLAAEAVTLTVVYLVVTRLFEFRARGGTALFQQRQTQFVRRLRERLNDRLRQRLLDEMMTDDLLAAANLDDIDLRGCYLERANLAQAHLARADLTAADLERARLQHAMLSEADLHGARMTGADLRSAALDGIDLTNAVLANSDLSGASLRGATLCNATLFDAELVGAQLIDADLRGASLLYANLTHADLHGAQFDAHTVLPDGSAWTPDTDAGRYTDPAHPDYRSFAGADSSVYSERHITRETRA